MCIILTMGCKYLYKPMKLSNYIFLLLLLLNSSLFSFENEKSSEVSIGIEAVLYSPLLYGVRVGYLQKFDFIDAGLYITIDNVMKDSFLVLASKQAVQIQSKKIFTIIFDDDLILSYALFLEGGTMLWYIGQDKFYNLALTPLINAGINNYVKIFDIILILKIGYESFYFKEYYSSLGSISLLYQF